MTAPRGYFLAFEALWSAYAGICPANGYRTHLGYGTTDGPRVISKLIVPGTSGAPATPYLCLPFETAGEPVGTAGPSLTDCLILEATAYLSDSEKDTLDEARVIANLLQDMIECQMPDPAARPIRQWDLSLKGVDVAILGKRVISGGPDRLPYAEISVTTKLTFQFSRADSAAA